MSQASTPVPEANGKPTFDYSAVPINEVEDTRIKLLGLVKSLTKLHDDIARRSQLTPDIHNQYSVIITQLSTLSASLLHNRDIFSSRNVYPLPTFPSTQQEGLLNTLLRKKPAPETSEWIDSSSQCVTELGVNVNAKREEDVDFMANCLEVFDQQRDSHNFFGVFTQQEIDDGEAQKDHDYKVVKKVENDTAVKGKSVNEALRFMHSGV